MGGTVKAKAAELHAACGGLKIPEILALRRMVLHDGVALRCAPVDELDRFFVAILREALEEFSFESLDQAARRGFAPLLPPGSEAARDEDRRLLAKLSHPLLGNHTA